MRLFGTEFAPRNIPFVTVEENGMGTHISCYAWDIWQTANRNIFKDVAKRSTFCDVHFLRVYHVGLLCVQQDRFSRPSADDLPCFLYGERDLPEPKIPPPSGRGWQQGLECKN